VRNWLNSYVSLHPTSTDEIFNQLSFLQEAKLKPRLAPVMIGASTATSSTTSLATANSTTSTGAEADTEETTASEGETDKKDEKWVAVPSEQIPAMTTDAVTTATS